MAFDTLLEEALDGWRDVREGVIREAENIPADRYDFRPAEKVRSVTGLLRHIMEVSQMMAGELSREKTNFHRLPFRELIDRYAEEIGDLEGKEALVRALRETLEEGSRRLREAGELHMLQLIERFDGESGTRLAWLHHGVAQEMYHRGQLCTYQRLMGITPALTRRIRGAD